MPRMTVKRKRTRSSSSFPPSTTQTFGPTQAHPQRRTPSRSPLLPHLSARRTRASGPSTPPTSHTPLQHLAKRPTIPVAERTQHPITPTRPPQNLKARHQHMAAVHPSPLCLMRSLPRASATIPAITPAVDVSIFMTYCILKLGLRELNCGWTLASLAQHR